MKLRIIFIFSAMLMSVIFGCSKDDSPSDSLVGEWIGNDVYAITTRGDSKSHESIVFAKEKRSKIVFNADGTGVDDYFDEAGEPAQEKFTYTVSGNQMTFTSSDGEVINFTVSISVYQSIARLTAVRKEEEPNGVQHENRLHYIRR